MNPPSFRAVRRACVTLVASACTLLPAAVPAQQTQKPPLHARQWLAITGKPLAATAGAMTFQKGGNAVDAACAMLAAAATMWDTLGWGGETQALVYDPHARKVIAINALGVAPSGATPAFFRGQGLAYPPEYGPLAAVTPGTPGGLLVMLAEYGRLSLADVLAPAIEMADGYPIEAQLATTIEHQKGWLKRWPYSRSVLLPHAGTAHEAPEPGEIFRQPELAATLRKLVDAERAALAAGRSRHDAIMAAYERFYRGDIADELVRGVREQGGLFTRDDLARWQVKIEEPRSTTYRGIDVYKLDVWTQGPAMLQALDILENFDLKSMGFNSARYIHTVAQAMHLAFADRDFWYGDPYFPPDEPIRGLLSKDYARERAKLIDPARNDPNAAPGDPYPFQGDTNPFAKELQAYIERQRAGQPAPSGRPRQAPDSLGGTGVTPTAAVLADPSADLFASSFYLGTTSVIAADAAGWLVAVTPSGGWSPAVIAGSTGIGLSQRMQAFVLDPTENPFNVVAPGKRPRATLTPSLALRDGKPWLAFAVQGGDTQDQNLLQFFLDIVEFGMTPQQAAEAANINSFQMHDSFDDHARLPGRMLVNEQLPDWVRRELKAMGYRLDVRSRTSGPINAIMVDPQSGTFWGASSNHGEDYGIGW